MTSAGGQSTQGNITKGGAKRAKASLETSYVTLVVPNLVDSVQIRAIFDEAVTYEGEDEEEEIEKNPSEDLLLNHILLETINTHKTNLANKKNTSGETKKIPRGKCPFCRNSRLKDKLDPLRCICNYHLVYAYKMQDEKPLRIITKSKQRGGPARLLHTPLSWHTETKTKRGYNQPQFFRLRDGYREKDIS